MTDFYKYLVWFFLLLPIAVYPQGQEPACFKAVDSVGCAPFTVTVNACHGPGSSSYDFGDGTGTQPPNVNVHTYTTPGKYAITHFYTPLGGGQTPLLKPDYITVLATPPPLFETRICEGNTVNVTVLDLFYPFYRIDFDNDGATDATVPASSPSASFTYPDSSPRQIRVTGNHQPGNCGGSATASVQPLSVFPVPEIAQLEASGTSLLLTFANTASGITYRLLQNTSGLGYQPVVYLKNTPQTYQVDNIDPALQHCFILEATDTCNGAKPSYEVCSSLLSATALDSRDSVAWSPQPALLFTSYQLFSNGSVALLTTDPAGNRFINTPVACNETHCYRVVSSFRNTVVISDETCIQSFSGQTPPAITDLTPTVNGGSIELSWVFPAAQTVKEVRLSRSEDAGAETLIFAGQGLAHTDAAADPSAKHTCYRLEFTDSCDNVSPVSLRACAILLRVEQLDKKEHLLDWTALEGWQNGVMQYEVEKLDEGFSPVFSANTGSDLTYRDTESNTQFPVLRYRIKAVSNPPQPFISYSNIVEIRQNFELVLPNAFTPNGDGLNDRFGINLAFVTTFKVVIFNKWGEEIYAFSELEGAWDGTVRGKEAPSGQYSYKVEAQDADGRTYTKRGTITLIR